MQKLIYFMRRVPTGLRLVFAGLICVGILAGCQLPNVGPFVDATGQLKGAVASSGTAVELELRLMGADALAKDLKANWAARDKAMTALLAYAESLDAIVAAGKSGAESAGSIADSIKGLAGAAGVAIPGSPEMLAVATDTAKFLYAQIANVRAAKQLSKALTEAQPAVEKIAEVMRKDLMDLDKIVQGANQIIQTAASTEMSASGLQDQRKSLREEMKKVSDLSSQTNREAYARLSPLMAEVDARYAVYEAKLAASTKRVRASRQLINAADLALDSWTAGHAQLAVAARNKTTVSTTALLDAAVELRDLVKRIREL